MRCLIKVIMPTEAGNALVRSGKLGEVLGSILADLKPEAVYFVEENGLRTALIFADVANSTDIVRVAEPFFLALGAAVHIHPAMTPADLHMAEPHMKAAVEKYG